MRTVIGTRTWVWINTDQGITSETYTVPAGEHPRRMDKFGGTWVAITSREAPFVNSIKLVQNMVYVNGKAYPVQKIHSVFKEIKRNPIRPASRKKTKEIAKESKIISRIDQKIDREKKPKKTK